MAYIRFKSVIKKNEKRYIYAYLVENKWNQKLKQPRQRVLKYIGKIHNLNLILAKKIFEMYNYTCQYCGKKENLTIDHKIPLSKGGNNEEENMWVLCMGCNQKKRDLLPT